MQFAFHEPPLTTSLAQCLALSFASSYVVSLYVLESARLAFSSSPNRVPGAGERRKEDKERWRDDPDVIRARLVAVSIATLLCCGGVFLVLWQLVGRNGNNFGIAFETTGIRLGFYNNQQISITMIYPHLVMPLLFFGPLYARFLGSTLPFQKGYIFQIDFLPVFTSWRGVRNYVLGPITEEIVFRACILSVYHLCGASKLKMIFLSPLCFGLAHIHHAWDTYNRFGRTSVALKRTIVMTLFQLSYTTIFGFYCSYLFLRTGSIYPCITAHIFCNIMGVPQITSELTWFPRRKGAIIGAYLTGIFAFAFTLSRWTLVENSLYWHNNTSGQVMY